MPLRGRRSDSRAARVVGLALLLAAAPGEAAGEFVEDWHVFGSNTVRGSVYSVTGSVANSPYPFEGDMYHDEVNVYFNRSDSRFSSWRGELSGVYDLNDDYRSTRRGLVPERLNLTREDGSVELPYRAELGDVFTYFSYLTQQSSIKGVQLELQPGAKPSGARHSVQLFSGAVQSDWRGLDPDEDYGNGVSWLVSDPRRGSLSVNLVHNFRGGSSAAGTLDRNQLVASVAGERPFTQWGQDFVFEGELALFGGDHDGLAGAASGQDRADSGQFLQLSGNSRALPWDYELRYQRYGQDFRPRGAVVTADRRSLEAFSNWRFDSGVLVRLRGQRFEDALETTNVLRTHTYGINLTGPLLRGVVPDATANVDFFVQRRRDQTRATIAHDRTFSATFSKPLPDDWNGRLALFVQSTDDATAANVDAVTRQVSVGADHALHVLGFEGFITPGILVRTVRGGGTRSDDWNPTLAASLSRGPHQVRMDYGGLFRDGRVTAGAADLDTHSVNLDYQYRRGQSVFGLEANLSFRAEERVADTDAYRVSAYWTHEFDRPPAHLAGTRTLAPIGAPGEVADIRPSAGLASLAPGTGRASIEAGLLEAGIANGARQGDFVVYETALLRNVPRRQRLALQYLAGALVRSAFIVELGDVGDRDTVAQVFDEVQQALIRELGTPTRVYESGRFTASFAADVNDQRLIRVSEWKTPSGVVRFGIPRRLDREVRIEVQHAAGFPPPGQTLWSVESVR